MGNAWKLVQWLFTALGAWIGVFVGGLDGFMYALIIFVCIDYVTGVLAAIVKHELSSAVGFIGIIKKILIFLLVGLANTIDMSVLQTPGVLRMAVIFYYISNEGISILENYTEIGLPVPRKVVEVLAQIRKRSDEPPDIHIDPDDVDGLMEEEYDEQEEDRH